MEIQKIKDLKIAILPEDVVCDELNKKNAELFYTADNYSVPILKEVVEEFEDALKDKIGINTKRLKKTVEEELRIGSIEFKIKYVPTSNPSYQAIGERIEQYLIDIKGLNEDGMKREGVRTIDGEPFIRLEDILLKVDKLKEDNKNETVRVNIDYSELTKNDIGKILVIEPGMYASITGDNAKTYRIAKEQIKMLNKNIINPFKSALKAETGWSKENVPAETHVDLFEIGTYIFMITSAPREEVKYGEAAKGFISIVEDPGSLAKQRDGNLYLPVNALVDKYNNLLKKNTRQIVQQDINIMPQPKYDHVLVE